MGNGVPPGPQDRRFAEGYTELAGAAVVLAVIVLSLLRGWLDLAFLTASVAAGFYAAKLGVVALSDNAPVRNGALAVVASCAVLTVLGALGVLPPLAVRGFGVWAPLFGLLLPMLLGLLFAPGRRTDGEKLRIMLDLYPHPSGGRWDAERMEEATDGEVTPRFFGDLERGRGSVLGPDPDRIAAMARAMDFPLEVWYRKVGWWRKVHEGWERGEDVREKLHEWDCAAPEAAAQRLGLSRDEILRMVSSGVLEGRLGPDGRWQVRDRSIMEQELVQEGKGHLPLPPHPRNHRPGRTGTGRFLDRKGRPQRGGDR